MVFGVEATVAVAIEQGWSGAGQIWKDAKSKCSTKKKKRGFTYTPEIRFVTRTTQGQAD